MPMLSEYVFKLYPRDVARSRNKDGRGGLVSEEENDQCGEATYSSISTHYDSAKWGEK